MQCCRFVSVDLHQRNFCAFCGTDFRLHSPIADLGKQINDTYTAQDQLKKLNSRTQAAAVITFIGSGLVGGAMNIGESWAMGLCAMGLGLIVLWRLYVETGIRLRYPRVFKNDNWVP